MPEEIKSEQPPHHVKIESDIGLFRLLFKICEKIETNASFRFTSCQFVTFSLVWLCSSDNN